MKKLILAAVLFTVVFVSAATCKAQEIELDEVIVQAPVEEKSFTQTAVDTLGTPEAFAVCKAADVITTKIAFSHGAIEANPMMHAVMTKLGFAGFVGLSVALVYLVYHYREQLDPHTIAVLTVATCGVATHNLMVP